MLVVGPSDVVKETTSIMGKGKLDLDHGFVIEFLAYVTAPLLRKTTLLSQ